MHVHVFHAFYVVVGIHSNDFESVDFLYLFHVFLHSSRHWRETFFFRRINIMLLYNFFSSFFLLLLLLLSLPYAYLLLFWIFLTYFLLVKQIYAQFRQHHVYLKNNMRMRKNTNKYYEWLIKILTHAGASHTLNITIQFGLITKFTRERRHRERKGERDNEQINELKIKREWKR